jgi:beta-lactamase class A
MHLFTRRECLNTLSPAIVALMAGRRLYAATPAALDASSVRPRLEELEKKSGGRLGVAILDTASGASGGHRDDERFPMCSTHKLLSAGAVLMRVDQGKEHLDRKLHFTQQDLIAYSPVTQSHVGDIGITIREACEAAVTLSDNTAANLLLASIGGPAGFTAFTRTLGDNVTRLDRNEPTLNEALPGDPRDTTSPRAIIADLRALARASRDLLTTWLLQCKTGARRLHAGLPADWKEGDKTGTGQRGTSNDVAIVWPPQCPPILIAAYLTESPLGDPQREEILAGVGKLVAAQIKA